MSFSIGDLLGTSAAARTSTQATTPTAPQSTTAARDELIARTRGFAAEPFQPYVDEFGRAIPRVAQFTPDQQRAFESTRQLATQAGGLSALTPELTTSGIEATRGMAITLPEANLQAYMSPYMQGVLDPAIRDIEERGARSRLALGQQRAMTGSFGGSRQAIAEGELERGIQRNIGEESARQRALAYNQAVEQFRQDQTRIPQLYANMQGMLGTGLNQTQGALGSMVNPLLATGGQQMAREQQNLDVLRQQYEEERDFPLRGINALRSTLGLNPGVLGVGETKSTTGAAGSPLNQILGLASGVYGNLPPSIAGSINKWWQGIGTTPAGELSKPPATTSGSASASQATTTR
jgi:hypothetical protein